MKKEVTQLFNQNQIQINEEGNREDPQNAHIILQNLAKKSGRTSKMT